MRKKPTAAWYDGMDCQGEWSFVRTLETGRGSSLMARLNGNSEQNRFSQLSLYCVLFMSSKEKKKDKESEEDESSTSSEEEEEEAKKESTKDEDADDDDDDEKEGEEEEVKPVKKEKVFPVKNKIVQYGFKPLPPVRVQKNEKYEEIPAETAPLFRPVTPPPKEEEKKEEEDEEIYLDPLRRDHVPKKTSQPLQRFSQALNVTYKEEESSILNWKVRKEKILEEYKTNKELPIHSTILAQHVSADNVSFENRLKQRLSMLSADRDKRNITQKKYIKFLEDLNDELKEAWGKSDRVHALKIVIKCTKMLSKTIVPEFYPSMFIIVVEVMDTFGKLVFQRIRSKSVIKDRYTKKIQYRLPKVFASSQVPGRAKEICKNWFFKIASIRELIARLYVEMMIIESRKFLFNDFNTEMQTEFDRCVCGIRGMGDPLVATYARMFIAKKGVELIPGEIGHVMKMVEDFYHMVQVQMKEKNFLMYLRKVHMDLDQFFFLLIPATDWLFEVLGRDGQEKIFLSLLHMYETNLETTGQNLSFLLNGIISAFPAQFVGKHVYPILKLIRKSLNVADQQIRVKKEREEREKQQQEEKRRENEKRQSSTQPKTQTQDGAAKSPPDRRKTKKKVAPPPTTRKKSNIPVFKTYKLYRSVGAKFTQKAPLEKKRLDVLNSVWKVVTKRYETKLREYLLIAEVFVEYIMKVFGLREVNLLLKDVFKHVSDERDKLLQQQSAKKKEDEEEEVEGEDEDTKKKNKKNDGKTKFGTSKSVETKKEEAAAEIIAIAEGFEEEGLSKNIQELLKRILLSILRHLPPNVSLIEVFNMQHFLPLFDTLHSSSKLEVAKGILKALVRPIQEGFTPKPLPVGTDPVLLNSLFELAKCVRDSVNFLSPPEELKGVEDLLFQFVRALDFGEDATKQIDFYIECRKAFPYFDRVNEIMVLNVLSIIRNTEYSQLLLEKNERLMNPNFEDMKKKEEEEEEEQQKQKPKKNERVIKNFVKSCFAFVQITLPSIRYVCSKIRYHLLASSLALRHGMIPQAEDMVKQCVLLIKDIPPFTKEENVIIPLEKEVVEIVSEISSFLISVPGHPINGPFYLYRGLLNSIENYRWPNEGIGRIRAYLRTCRGLCACYHQETLPYTFKQIQLQNTELFPEEKMRKEVGELIQIILQQVAKHVDSLRKELDGNVVKQTKYVIIDFLNLLWNKTAVWTREIFELTVSLFDYVKDTHSSAHQEVKGVRVYLRNSLRYLNKRNRKLRAKYILM